MHISEATKKTPFQFGGCHQKQAVLQNKYTIESDVCAFGVLLWEIFSSALQPYYGLSDDEVVKNVKSGKVLLSPENTPKSVYIGRLKIKKKLKQ